MHHLFSRQQFSGERVWHTRAGGSKNISSVLDLLTCWGRKGEQPTHPRTHRHTRTLSPASLFLSDRQEGMKKRAKVTQDLTDFQFKSMQVSPTHTHTRTHKQKCFFFPHLPLSVPAFLTSHITPWPSSHHPSLLLFHQPLRHTPPECHTAFKSVY